MNENLRENIELKKKTKDIIEKNNGNPVIDCIVKEVATLSTTPMIVEIRTAKSVFDNTNTYENMVTSRSTAEAMPFKLLIPDEKSTDYFVNKFIKFKYGSESFEAEKNGIVDFVQPSYEELEGAFSRILSQDTYADFSAFLKKFNEPGLESLECMGRYIFMEHPIKINNRYEGKIRIDPKSKYSNQANSINPSELFTYTILDV